VGGGCNFRVHQASEDFLRTKIEQIKITVNTVDKKNCLLWSRLCCHIGGVKIVVVLNKEVFKPFHKNDTANSKLLII